MQVEGGKRDQWVERTWKSNKHAYNIRLVKAVLHAKPLNVFPLGGVLLKPGSSASFIFHHASFIFHHAKKILTPQSNKLFTGFGVQKSAHVFKNEVVMIKDQTSKI